MNQLANTSDLLFDPGDGWLYATLPQTDSVGVFESGDARVGRATDSCWGRSNRDGSG